MTEDEQVEADADEAIAEQTPVYPVTKLTARKHPEVTLTPMPDGNRMKLSPTQVHDLYRAYGIMQLISKHAEDRSRDRARTVMSEFVHLLEFYPVEWVEPKKHKPK